MKPIIFKTLPFKHAEKDKGVADLVAKVTGHVTKLSVDQTERSISVTRSRPIWQPIMSDETEIAISRCPGYPTLITLE